MKKAKIFSLLAAAFLLFGLIAGCGTKAGGSQTAPAAPAAPAGQNGGQNNSSAQTITLKGIADLVPHSEIIEYVKPKLAQQGIDLVLVSTAADNTTNEKTAKGEIDFNYFQHYPYLESWNETNGFNLVNAGDIHVAPMNTGLCVFWSRTVFLS